MKQFVRRGRLAAHAGAPIVLGYIVVALVLGYKGDTLGAHIFANRLSPMSSASAIAILSSLASGMMALTAIVFSLVIVAVQFGATAYSPRLIRAIGTKPSMAHALGIFTGTFVHALIAIRTVDVAGRPGINLSVVVVAGLWLLASIAMLVRVLPLIHGFVIWDVLAALQRRAVSVAVRVYPSDHASAGDPPDASADLPSTRVVVHTGGPRYLTGLDVRRLVRCAVDADAVITMPLAIGDPAIAGDPLAIVRGGARPIAESELRSGIWLSEEREIENDPGYAIRLLVDIAIRALSPAVNDPTTAVSVLDGLDGLLRVLGHRRLEDAQSTDDRGVVRLVRAVPTWDDLVALAFTEIHYYGRDSFQVERRIATVLRDLPDALPPVRRPAIERFSRWRTRTLADVLHDGSQWLDASGIDRQGIGHEAAGSRLS